MFVDLDPVGDSGVDLDEILARLHPPVVDEVSADVMAAHRPFAIERGGVGDVEDRLVGGEREPVGLDEVGDGDCESSLGRDAEDPMIAVLATTGVALLGVDDPVGGVGEPDGAVGGDDDVVRGVESRVVPVVDDGADLPVPIAFETPSSVGALDDRAVEIDGPPVDVVGALEVDGRFATRGIEVPHAVADDVGEAESIRSGDPAGAFEPAPPL